METLRNGSPQNGHLSGSDESPLDSIILSILGITSALLIIETTVPIPILLFSTKLALLRVTLLIVAPLRLTGSIAATGVYLPVLPICQLISVILVSELVALNL